MSNVNNLITLLENFDFSTVDNSSTSSSIDAVMNFLRRAETHLASCAASASPSVSPTISQPDGQAQPSSNATISQGNVQTLPSPIAALVDIREGTLEENLLQSLKTELQAVTFTAMSNKSHSPDITLFGDSQYVFNYVTKNLMPVPLVKDSIISQVLDTVNSKLGLNYNSILVNKYKTKNVSLGWHKDDEAEIDTNVPISSLSFGAIRRFQICDVVERSKRSQFFECELKENSLITMNSGIHRTHFHRVAQGRRSKDGECGIRYSLTFRRLNSTPPTPSKSPVTFVRASTAETSPTQVTTQAHRTHIPASNHDSCINTLVFGSSLTKDLDANILSKRGKTFKVFTKGGARVETIISMIKEAVDKGEVCLSCVESVFIVGGGNDAENVRSTSGIEKLKASYQKLIDVLNSKFCNIRINILSLIPRRCNSYLHLQRIFIINNFYTISAESPLTAI